MNQNILGAILFSLIVGSAILISEFFVVLPTPEPVFETQTYIERNERPLSCNKKRLVNSTDPSGKASIKIVQSVLNLKENQLITEYSVKKESPQTETVGFLLHFFVKDGAKTEYILTEPFQIKPEFDYQGKATQTLTSFAFPVITKNQTLYLIVEPGVSFNNSEIPIKKFDLNKATPVLLDKGK